jgi:putative hemolysin
MFDSETRVDIVEFTEQLLTGTPARSSEDVRFSYSRPEQHWFNRTIIRLIERMSGQPRLERLYKFWTRSPIPGENIFTAALRLMEIGIETDYRAWDRIPSRGPLLFVANHPFGVIDGLLMGHLATRIRPDTKIMTHSLLCQPPEARDYLLPVDFGGTAQAQQVSLLTRRRTLEWLSAGHAVAVFPAGSVSTSQAPFGGPALEPQWHPFVGKLLRIPELVIVPVYFHGQNSRLFQILSHIHYALRIALLFRETTRRIGTTVRVSIGEPIFGNELTLLGSRKAALRELRYRTLLLHGAGGPDPLLEFTWPSHISFD